MDPPQASFDYLRPPVDATLFEHDPSYIKSGTSDLAQRRIFYSVPLDEYEIKAIREFEVLISRRGVHLPEGWNERESLRYLYATRFNIEAAASRINEMLQWRARHNRNLIPPNALRLLETGAIYTYGRDVMFRPVIIFDLEKYNLDTMDLESFEIAAVTLLDILREYCFIPGKIESWVVIVNCPKKDLTYIPFDKLQSVFGFLNTCFPLSLERCFVLNSTPSVNSLWTRIEALLGSETSRKVEFLTNIQLTKLKQYIPSNQLEFRFGGILHDLHKYWIPRVPLNSSLPPIAPSQKGQSLEHSLARLTQQIESVEGRFNRVLGNELTAKRSATVGPAQASMLSTNFTAPSPYNIAGTSTTNYNVSSSYLEGLGLESGGATDLRRSGVGHERVLKSAHHYGETAKRATLPAAHHEDTFLTRQLDLKVNEPAISATTTIPYTTSMYVKNYVESSAQSLNHFNDAHVIQHVSEPTEGYDYYSDKDRDLLDLIASENEYIQRNKPVVKALPEQSTLTPENPNRTSVTPTKYNQGTTIHYEVNRSSLPVDMKASGQFDVSGKDGYSYMKSSQVTTSNRDMDEWQYQKYLKPIAVEEEEEDEDDIGEGNFCGLCVSKRGRAARRDPVYAD